ncbi:hypothetical protein JCM10207_005672 [Rhodosporidiobolus poonsookiae]
MASPRRVAVAVAFQLPLAGAPPSEPVFLLVSSRKKDNRYVFPKGGIEQGETAAEAAEREAWEEAGLEIGTAQHLAHLLTLYDPSPHILSPTSDPTSPSFVPSCEYSFELFLLPPAPEPASDGHTSPAPAAANGASFSPSPAAASDFSSSSLAPSIAASSPSPSTAPSASVPPPAAAPPPTAPPSASHPSLPSTWPESTERHRLLVTGWAAAEASLCWGRREGVMRQAIEAAREWVEAWERAGWRIEEEGEEEEG